MESLTKNKQSNDNLERMIYAAFGEKLRIGDGLTEVKVKELKEGFFNVAYEIILPDQSVILKIAPPVNANIMTYEKNMMEVEVDSLRLVKDKTNVPVPEVLFYDSSHLICDADYFFMSKVEGISFSQAKKEGMSSDVQEQILKQVGYLNKEMNQITGNNFGYVGLKEMQGSNWEDVFETMVESILKDGERVKIDLGLSYEEVRNTIKKSKGALRGVIEPKFVHWDIWDGNVFVHNGSITAIIDFERAMWADPLMEYFFRAHSSNEAFNSGYGENLRKNYPVKALLYDLYLYLIMAIETGYRCYADDGQYHFALEQIKNAIQNINRIIGNKLID